MKPILTLLTALLMAMVAALTGCGWAIETEPTVVRVTEKVLLKNVMRIGMNTSWEASPWDIPMWKLTAEENFEGGVKRQCCTFTGKSGPEGWEIFEAAGPFGTAIQGFAKDTVTTLKDQPVIWSYALRDGKRRAVILVNLDTKQARPVRLDFDGAVKAAAHQIQLAADSLTANNELDWNPDKPQVELRESVLANFRTGQSLTLPPHSMTTLQWETP